MEVKLCEIVFEEGDSIRRLKGEIIKEDESFITLKTLSKEYRINKNRIIKIETDLAEE